MAKFDAAFFKDKKCTFIDLIVDTFHNSTLAEFIFIFFKSLFYEGNIINLSVIELIALEK